MAEDLLDVGVADRQQRAARELAEERGEPEAADRDRVARSSQWKAMWCGLKVGAACQKRSTQRMKKSSVATAGQGGHALLQARARAAA